MNLADANITKRIEVLEKLIKKTKSKATKKQCKQLLKHYRWVIGEVQSDR